MLCALKMEILLVITALCVCDELVTDGFILRENEFVTSLQSLKEAGLKAGFSAFEDE